MWIFQLPVRSPLATVGGWQKRNGIRLVAMPPKLDFRVYQIGKKQASRFLTRRYYRAPISRSSQFGDFRLFLSTGAMSARFSEHCVCQGLTMRCCLSASISCVSVSICLSRARSFPLRLCAKIPHTVAPIARIAKGIPMQAMMMLFCLSKFF